MNYELRVLNYELFSLRCDYELFNYELRVLNYELFSLRCDYELFNYELPPCGMAYHIHNKAIIRNSLILHRAQPDNLSFVIPNL